MPHPKVTLKIPKPLYEHISRLIEGSGFNSVTDFVVFVLRDIVYEGRLPSRGTGAGTGTGAEAGAGAGQPARGKAAPGGKAGGKAAGAAAEDELPEFTGEQLERIKKKLKQLGYL